jgi:hypothetical protein
LLYLFFSFNLKLFISIEDSILKDNFCFTVDI